ncbi:MULTISPECIES: 3-methyl-2-oxobutanoate hydroxymethyltransferase [Idiomarinaceae]|uniref:3-methyl-2-oxobutanoate hydroxymethyltransferase n=4 Tax=Pseudidiomarina TaxID=2800384 RepID=A0A368UV44_9GAMM|nr:MULTISPECIES: 3-methyl-2-oxobutanoate hydroxymethyltransferase [Idiomarinaceae]MDT7525755.1 3-methyl-2-oxobutanoate hydroxymethyltransferase [Pseudidiomarina sp. GXY010]MDX1525595.1 3-methyl-2-oxobutanoate hydroxymethyltransferase [Pseudidiomarina maritima]MRJ42509.1 3-methyl-2-oxobutanoate hydroxymethyltransferase [Idiomarina sp. FeN1]NCU58123.1 3-methyl-2-oxobutanoate hydroxymethyltransferase [Idiomarina sp. FenA--70]NCU60821.1 3-methyl-2-oxobutanoate hydroxymethyltransferase [Idiomarina 
MAAMTIAKLAKKKLAGEKITSITAYDASFAKLFAECGVDFMLVGDSLGNVVQGQSSTLPVTLADIVYHTQAVRRGAPEAFVMADMPFMTYASPAQACDNAAELMRAGANMVKLEGGDWLLETIRCLVERSVPVCAHLGLLPQSVNVLGGYKIQGREQSAADNTLRQALALQEAGAQLLVLECVPVALGQRISEALTIPTIGIGAGPHTDGQILVMHDMFGLNSDYLPKFVKNFLADAGDLRGAVEMYVAQVKAGQFPGPEHSFE